MKSIPRSLARLLLIAILALTPFPSFAQPASSPITKSDAASSFIRGNVNYFLLHELGHLLVWAYDLPVLGREEDAVDDFATYHMTRLAIAEAVDGPASQRRAPSTAAGKIDLLARVDRMENEKDEIAQRLAHALIDIEAPSLFFSALGKARESGQIAINWWDEHGADEQRAARIKCLTFGSVYHRIVIVADVWNIPEEGRARCAQQAAANKRALDKLLQPWLAQSDHMNEVFSPDSPLAIPARPPRALFSPKTLTAKIIFEETPASTQAVKRLREFITADVLNEILMKYKPSPKMKASQISIHIKECGQANSFFNSSDETITLCTELVDLFLRAVPVTLEKVPTSSGGNR